MTGYVKAGAKVKKRTKKRGRPVGWRKPGARRESITVRLAEASTRWLRARAKSQEVSVGEIVRRMVERAMRSPP